MHHFDFYSPEEEILYAPFQKKGLRFFMKRDDLIHPFISGNKWRKLKYQLEEASQQGKTHLVSFGGAYSNHVLALACAAAKFGFRATAFIRGEEVSNAMLSLCRTFGMSLKFVSREAYKDKTQLFELHFKDQEDAYYIAEGGAGVLAEKGCREIIQELHNSYDHIFCAGGTGTTAAGIINALANKEQTQFHLVPALKNGAFLRKDIEPLLDRPRDFRIHTSYHFGGYAKTSPELIDFIKKFAAETGILLDPVYTSKTMFAIQDLAENDYFKGNEKILMLHTGGLFGMLGMMDKF